MKVGLALLLATVIPLGWAVLGVFFLCRFVASHRAANKSILDLLRCCLTRSVPFELLRTLNGNINPQASRPTP
jgi:hypothetical protein